MEIYTEFCLFRLCNDRMSIDSHIASRFTNIILGQEHEMMKTCVYSIRDWKSIDSICQAYVKVLSEFEKSLIR